MYKSSSFDINSTILATGLFLATNGETRDISSKILDGAVGEPRSIPLNSAEVYASQRKLIPYLLYAHAGGLLPLSLEDERYFRRCNEVFQIRANLFERCLVDISGSMKQGGIDPVLFKGDDLRQHYPDPWTRPSADSDILVHPKELVGASEALISAGYKHGVIKAGRAFSEDGKLRIYDANPHSARWVHESHHQIHAFYREFNCPELVPYIDILKGGTKYEFVTANEVRIAHIVDLHFNLAYGMEPSDYFHHFRSLNIGGTSMSALAPEMSICFYAGRAYYDALISNVDSVYDLIDAAIYYYKYYHDLDWDWIGYYCDRYAAWAPLYYFGEFVARFMQRPMPNVLMEKLAESMLSNRQFDLGPFIPKSLGYLPFGSRDSTIFA
ncbi:nucleotidyltransferase family protein (plasmid) [Rhizobium sp. CB3171]|uniref:nucleotidyltransferase family protein n=1 Tax=Rhizobium sp. CB3171 TaxID=3039157 RepID=UPI0024B129AD|nr:nucleotidyltransferase family protein [Rhizobium sp. CB3171]WFU04536.1 nucleotidyltransferase family protein [Rhizobium sp. CB3171]